MPYAIAKSGSGFKVRNKETGKTYSKHPQSKATARKQMQAIAIHTHEFSQGSQSGR